MLCIPAPPEPAWDHTNKGWRETEQPVHCQMRLGQHSPCALFLTCLDISLDTGVGLNPGLAQQGGPIFLVLGCWTEDW